MSDPRGTLRPRLSLLALLALAFATGGCFSGFRSVAPAARQQPGAGSEGRLFALIVNGGGTAQTNYRSHLDNVRSMIAILEERGVPRNGIAVFASDGGDPAPDLAVRGPGPADLWLLPRRLRSRFRPALQTKDSRLPGYRLRPATRAALEEWFDGAGKRLRRGDTLLVYVTDHGERGEPTDPLDNSITLWGEQLTVGQFRRLLEKLPPGVRVVSIMSQCFSGGFALALLPEEPDGVPDGEACGYFAATADRYAYGCYPENRGVDGVGHSFRIFSAAPLLGRLSVVEEYVQVADRTPDVPHATSDAFLARLLQHEAERRRRQAGEWIDQLLREALQNAGSWERELRLIDRIGRSFGLPGARSLAEIDRRLENLRRFNEQVEEYARRWQSALDALAADRFADFLREHPQWKERLSLHEWNEMKPAARGELGRLLLREWRDFLTADGESLQRMNELRRRAEEARAGAYRNEVREAAMLRMRSILIRIAGTYFLRTTPGLTDYRTALENLQRCEDFPLHPAPRFSSAAEIPLQDAFPQLAEERSRLADIRPAWLGVRYRPVPDSLRERLGVGRGAVAITEVFQDSAAARAGLEVADIVLGPPGMPFQEPHALREWVMSQEPGQSRAVQLLRDGELMEVTLRFDPFPLKVPEIPGPPKVGEQAPPVRARYLRGRSRLRADRSRIVFFWATWCPICKAALPELTAFARAHDATIVAVTDEDPVVVRRFLSEDDGSFPEVVAVDPFRITFQRFGVSGIPSIVWIDAEGTVRHAQTGYDPEKGLQVAGWQWREDPSMPGVVAPPGKD